MEGGIKGERGKKRKTIELLKIIYDGKTMEGKRRQDIEMGNVTDEG